MSLLQKYPILATANMEMIREKSAEKKEKKAAPLFPAEALLASMTQPLASAKSAMDQMKKKIAAATERT